MKKTAFARMLLILLLSSVLAGTRLVYLVLANPAPYASSGGQNIRVAIVSPENKTYNTSDILVTVTAGGFPGVVYVRYSLDDGPPIALDPVHWMYHNFSASVWLKQLPQGSHKIVATAKTLETSEVCSAVYFTVTDTLEPSPSPSPNATSGSQRIPLTIKVGGRLLGSGFCDLLFSVYVPYEIRTLYNCTVKVGYRTPNDEWKTASKNIGTVNYGDYAHRQITLEANFSSDALETRDFFQTLKIEGYGYLEPTSFSIPEPITTTAPTITQDPTTKQEPAPTPEPTAAPGNMSHPEPFPTTLVTVSASAVAVIVGIGLFVYSKKRNHEAAQS